MHLNISEKAANFGIHGCTDKKICEIRASLANTS